MFAVRVKIARWVVVAACTSLSLSESAWARRNGNVGVDCQSCHTGGTAPEIVLTTTPERPNPGDAVILTLRISSDSLSVAGFSLAAEEFAAFNSLPGETTSIRDTAVTHSAPISGMAGTAEVNIGWTAPAEPGGVVFTVAAVAANGDGRSSGDAMALGRFELAWGCDAVRVYEDADGDGVGAAVYSTKLGCGDVEGWSTLDGDCNESDPAIHLGAAELCNEVDDNCDGEIDEGCGSEPTCAVPSCADSGAPTASSLASSAPAPTTSSPSSTPSGATVASAAPSASVPVATSASSSASAPASAAVSVAVPAPSSSAGAAGSVAGAVSVAVPEVIPAPSLSTSPAVDENVRADSPGMSCAVQHSTSRSALWGALLLLGLGGSAFARRKFEVGRRPCAGS